MTKISLQEAYLIKRTAWRNMQPRTPGHEDMTTVKKAEKMLILIGCLGYAVYGLEEEFEDARLFRHGTKRAVVRVRDIVRNCHGTTYDALRSVCGTSGRSYNNAVDKEWQIIEATILLTPPERSYNIVMALARIITRLNNELAHRYNYAPARAIADVPRLLAGIMEDREIDLIIELNVK